jgi:hypothetical protein
MSYRNGALNGHHPPQEEYPEHLRGDMYYERPPEPANHIRQTKQAGKVPPDPDDWPGDHILDDLPSDADYTDYSDNSEPSEENEPQPPLKGSVWSASDGVPLPTIDQIIRRTQPPTPGAYQRCVFKLARELKALPHLQDADPAARRDIVVRWQKLAESVIGEKPREEVAIDFLRGWERVRFPGGTGPLFALRDRARDASPPLWAQNYDQPELQLLVAVCRELQKNAGDGAWFLSCRTAGELVGVRHDRAARWLYLLVEDGVLTLIRKGTKKLGASVYHWNGE